MSGLLADLYSAGDRMKRKLGGLLSDPLETIALGSTRMAEDTNALTRLVSEAGYMPNTVNRSDQSVLVSERQKALARALLADKGAEMGMAAAIDPAAVRGVINDHSARLKSEADDWASRVYKGNRNTVTFKGDGPTRSEFMTIGAINSNRRDSNVMARMQQMDALRKLDDMVSSNPAKVEALFIDAQQTARQLADRDGWNYDTALEGLLGQKFGGAKDWVSGPNSIGGALRKAIEPHVSKSAVADDGADWMSQLFGSSK